MINEFVGTWKKYPYLEQRTGISARKWQNVCNRVQQPSIEMIAALAMARPYFLSWLLTGHCLPDLQVDPSKPGWQTALRTMEHLRLNEAAKALKVGATAATSASNSHATASEKDGSIRSKSKRPRQ